MVTYGGEDELHSAEGKLEDAREGEHLGWVAEYLTGLHFLIGVMRGRVDADSKLARETTAEI
jgi:hypothetical protein